jgi:putative ABC transport system permease protein
MLHRYLVSGIWHRTSDILMHYTCNLNDFEGATMAILSLAIKSLRNRKFTAGLTIASIALSVTLLLGVERIRSQAQTAFTNTVSGTDLIVGARSGPVSLLLYSVFRIGNPTNNISWESYEEIAQQPAVKWTIPISLGDSHKGYRVMGTNSDYFQYFRFARDRKLELAQGHLFADVYDAVLGAEVAEALGYRIEDAIVIAHGAGDVSFVHHDDKPFQVAGVLKRTGTPVDRTIHVQLAGIDAIHAGWENGAPVHQLSALDRHMHEKGHVHDAHHEPEKITAFLVGLKSRTAAFAVQRFVNEYSHEPLTAILPGVALQELWELVGVAEKALLAVSAFVVVVGLFGMLTALLTSLNERRREMAILRSVGARPLHVFSLIVGEVGFVTMAGIITGIALLYGLHAASQPLITSKFGLFISIGGMSAYELILMGIVGLAGLFIGIIPGYRIYRYSLADGMTVRV